MHKSEKQLKKVYFDSWTDLARSAVIVPAFATIIICEYCCGCQLLLSMIMHAMKRQSCILNEDVLAVLICGGKDRHCWATMEMSVMFNLLLSLSPANCINADETKRTRDRGGKQGPSL